MKVLISLADTANRFAVNHNENWHSITDGVQPANLDMLYDAIPKKRRGMKRSKKKIPKNEGTEMDLQPSFGMEAGFR